MRLGGAAMTAAVVCVWSNVVGAADAPEEPQLERNWAVAIGVGWIGIGGVAGGIGIPGFRATLERRLDDRLWAMTRFDGAYAAHQLGADGRRAWSLGGAVGIRHALTPPDPVEVSWYSMLEGRYDRDVTASLDSWGAGLRLGLALDKHFNEWFGLRVSLDVLHAGYQRGQVNDIYGVTMVTHEEWFAAVALSPSFALRFSF